MPKAPAGVYFLIFNLDLQTTCLNRPLFKTQNNEIEKAQD